MEYTSDIILGDKYRDDQTGIEGIATVISFFQHGCERVNLEYAHEGTIYEFGFDAARLTNLSTKEKAKVEDTGGPQRGVSHVRPTQVRGR